MMPNPSLEDTQPIKRLPPPNSTLAYGIFAIAVMMLLTILAVLLLTLIENEQRVSVRLRIDDSTYTITTKAQTIAQFLNEQRVYLEAGDLLHPALDSTLQDNMTITLNRARTVILTVDGHSTTLRTTRSYPYEILRDAAVEVQAMDEIKVNGAVVNPQNLAAMRQIAQEISVNHALLVSISVDSQTSELYTTAKTVGEALHDAGVSLFLADAITPELTSPLSQGMQISVRRASALSIRVDGLHIETRTGGVTVGEALAETGIALVGLDYTTPDESTAIQPGMMIQVVRVREALLDVQIITDYQTRYQADPYLPPSTYRVIQEGQPGLTRQAIRVRYENDVETSRIIEVEVSAAEARDRIIAYGTSSAPVTAPKSLLP